MSNIVVLRVGSIELRKFTTPAGSSIWFPISAEADTFPDGGFDATIPQYHEKYQLVRDTLIFNQNPSDSRFDVNWRSAKFTSLIPSSLNIKSENMNKQTDKKNLPMNNPSQIEKNLELQLLDADRQASELKASSPSKYIWSNTTLLQIGISFVGIASLISAYILKKKYY